MLRVLQSSLGLMHVSEELRRFSSIDLDGFNEALIVRTPSPEAGLLARTTL